MKKQLIITLILMLIIGCSENKVKQEKVISASETKVAEEAQKAKEEAERQAAEDQRIACLLYTSDAADE